MRVFQLGVVQGQHFVVVDHAQDPPDAAAGNEECESQPAGDQVEFH